MEMWRHVVGWEGYYSVSSLGRIRSDKRAKRRRYGRIIGGYGGQYPEVELRLDGIVERRYIHHLVLRAFAGDSAAGQVANHKNGIKHDNRVTNLEWVTVGQNNKHAYDTGLKVISNVKFNPLKGEACPGSKLTADQVREIRAISGVSQPELGRRYGVAQTTISAVKNGYTWKWLD